MPDFEIKQVTFYLANGSGGCGGQFRGTLTLYADHVSLNGNWISMPVSASGDYRGSGSDNRGNTAKVEGNTKSRRIYYQVLTCSYSAKY
jgi:hypothetical protein